MVSPNTLKLQNKDENGNDKLCPTSITVLQGRPNFVKRFIRDQKSSRARNTRGKRKIGG